jgi:DeoR/GlpR family transcriptional regulator of sugar metabolism
VVCDLHMINTVVTDANVSERDLKMLESAGARVVRALTQRPGERSGRFA